MTGLGFDPLPRSCTCGQPDLVAVTAGNMVHRTDGPCYLVGENGRPLGDYNPNAAEPVDEQPALICKGLLPNPDGVCMLIPLYEAHMRDLASTAARHLSEAWALSLKRAEALEYLRVHADLTEAQREMVEHLTTGPA